MAVIGFLITIVVYGVFALIFGGGNNKGKGGGSGKTPPHFIRRRIKNKWR